MQVEGHAGQEALESSQEAQAGQEALAAAVEQVLVAADAGQDAVAPGTEEETVQTPCKGRGPQGVQLDTPEKPAEEVKRKRGRPRKAAPEDPSKKVLRVPAPAVQPKVQPTLGRFFK